MKNTYSPKVYFCMKKFVLGIAWQTFGFFGAIIILCFVSPHEWEYNGITGILGSLFGLEMILPFLVCVVLFLVGLVITFKAIKEKYLPNSNNLLS